MDSELEQGCKIRLLDENDHDFAILHKDNKRTVVQCTEIVYRDFLLEGRKTSSRSVIVDGNHRYVDERKAVTIFADKIAAKLAKNYSKPADPFWLIIWSVTGYCEFNNYIEAGEKKLSAPLQFARLCLEVGTNIPFDKIYYFDGQTKPNRIWPAEQ